MLSENLTLTRMKELEFDYNGGKYHAPEDGYSLTVPKGAIPEKLGLVSMQCGVVPYGPVGTLKYPDGIKPVSPIVWFCMTSSVEFQKCVEITIPHCLDCETAEDSQSLAFFKANHNVSDISPRIFHFEKAEGISSFSPNTSYGTLHSKHLCFYCVGSSHKEVTNRANFYLITAKPVYFQRRSKIHFCLTYFLETCLKVSLETCLKVSLETCLKVHWVNNKYVHIVLHVNSKWAHPNHASRSLSNYFVTQLNLMLQLSLYICLFGIDLHTSRIYNSISRTILLLWWRSFWD